MSFSSTELLAALSYHDGETLFVPPDLVPGSWVGAPSAIAVEGEIFLAYRMRRPIGLGRGFANVVARSTNGRDFRTLAVILRERHDCDSLERPSLIHTPDGHWRLYISCATPGTKHWRVDLLEAATVQALPDATPRTVLAGDPARMAAKDTVIQLHDGVWHLWASCHPLDDPAATDRMTTEHAVSPNGIEWTWLGQALRGTEGEWDARGARFAEVIAVSDGYLALYDGRASYRENWEERTGAALAPSLSGPFRKVSAGPVFASPFGSGGLRYLAAVPDPGGRTRVYYESARADGAHELRTQLL